MISHKRLQGFLEGKHEGAKLASHFQRYVHERERGFFSLFFLSVSFCVYACMRLDRGFVGAHEKATSA